MVNFDQWNGFKGRLWKEEINVRDFVQNNYKPYDGDESFLEGPTEATNKLWGKLQELQKEERAKGGVLDMETKVVAGLTAYGPGYIDESMKELEQVVGLQTDKPLKRAFMPYGGIKMAEESCKNYGYEPNPELHKIFTEYHKTHNQGVFDAYTPEMRKARHSHIITGLPDTYGRGRIVGDYRRVALYGIDFLMEEKKKDQTFICYEISQDLISQNALQDILLITRYTIVQALTEPIFIRSNAKLVALNTSSFSLIVDTRNRHIIDEMDQILMSRYAHLLSESGCRMPVIKRYWI